MKPGHFLPMYWVYTCACILSIALLSGCGTRSSESPTPSVATSPTDEPVAAGVANDDAAVPTPTTPRVTPTATPLVADDGSGWDIYINEEYGFALRYPGNWTLDEQPNLLQLRRGTLVLAVAFRRTDEEVPAPWTGLPAGELEQRGQITVVQERFGRQVLVFDGRDKAVFYASREPVGDLALAFRLDDTGADYDAIDIAEGAQAEADAILETLLLLEQPEADARPTMAPGTALNRGNTRGTSGRAGDVVNGWIGRVLPAPPGAGIGSYFERDDSEQFHLAAADPTMAGLIDDIRWRGVEAQVWGIVHSDVPGLPRIQVERVEALEGVMEDARNFAPFAQVSASSTLPSDDAAGYAATNVLDGLPETSWIEGVEGTGVGESLTLHFPREIIIERIGVGVGYDSGEGAFFANNRVMRATLTAADTQIDLEFADARGIQEVALPPGVTANEVTLVIAEVYPGSEYDDTAISEVQVWGRPPLADGPTQ